MSMESRRRRSCQRFDLINSTCAVTLARVSGRDQVGNKQGIARCQQPVQVPNARLLPLDKVEIGARLWVCVNYWVFFVFSSTEVKPAVKPKKDDAVQSV